MTDRDARRRYAQIGLAANGALVLAIAALALVVYFGGGGVTVASAGSKAGAAMSMHDTPQSLPEVAFENGDGNPRSLADFRGKVVLLNIWATWCGPCRREMPTLDRLQAELGGANFEVVALSIDRAGIDAVAKFYSDGVVEHLAKYIDKSGKAARQINAVGLPTTLLIDRNGREIGRLVGPAAWDTPQMVAFLRKYLAREAGISSPAAARALRSASLDLPATGRTTSSATVEGNPS